MGMSTYLELLAIEAAIIEAETLAGKGWKTLVLAADSQAAASIMRKGYSTRSAEANTVCKRIESAIWRFKTLLQVFWIPRRVNWRADILSHPGHHESHEWAHTLPETVGELEMHPHRVQSRGHPPASHLTEHMLLRSTSHSGVDLPRKTQEQHGGLEQSSRISTGHEKSVPISCHPVHHSTTGAISPKTGGDHLVCVSASRIRKMGSPCSREIHHQDPLRDEMAGYSWTESAQSDKDELATQGTAAAQRLRPRPLRKHDVKASKSLQTSLMHDEASGIQLCRIHLKQGLQRRSAADALFKRHAGNEEGN